MATFDRAQVRAALDGISGILVTPFDDNGKIEPVRLQPIIDKAIDAGIHILVANGNTSEYYSLRYGESEAMVFAAAEQIRGRVPLLGGVGRGIEEACDLAAASCAAGADALMIHQPPDPFVSPRGILAYVRRIEEAAQGLPLVLYLRNEAIGMASIEALCSVDSVVGVKWASPTPLVLADAMARTRHLDIAWVGGLAETWAPPFYAVGARGFTSGLINVVPRHSAAIHAALEQGDYSEANRLIAQMRPFEQLRAEENNGANVTVVKTALQLLDHDCGATRPPSAWPMNPAALDTLRQMLKTWR
ncbi:MAG TPA: dihydrodipicolinate synthase family protein [Advenella sp.]|nr:dihydrodipicolinate synthase family protein [Advenella sp.]